MPSWVAEVAIALYGDWSKILAAYVIEYKVSFVRLEFEKQVTGDRESVLFLAFHSSPTLVCHLYSGN